MQETDSSRYEAFLACVCWVIKGYTDSTVTAAHKLTSGLAASLAVSDQASPAYCYISQYDKNKLITQCDKSPETAVIALSFNVLINIYLSRVSSLLLTRPPRMSSSCQCMNFRLKPWQPPWRCPEMSGL